MVNQEKELPPTSEEFWDAVIHSGSSVVDCELCGRTHFANAPRNEFDEGEYERLIRQNEANPNKYVYHPNEDSISWGNIEGKQAVCGCQCNKVSKYEQFIWNHRHIISDYLLRRTKKEREDAIKESKLAERVAEQILPKPR